MFTFTKELLVTTSQQSLNKKDEPVTYVTVLGDDYKTSDLYLKGNHNFEQNQKYRFKLNYNDNPFKYISVESYEKVK